MVKIKEIITRQVLFKELHDLGYNTNNCKINLGHILNGGNIHKSKL